MGDELLVSSAKFGDIDNLKSSLKLRSNPCNQGTSTHLKLLILMNDIYLITDSKISISIR